MSTLYHTRTLIARFKELTGKSYVEWCDLLESRPHTDSAAACIFLERQGLKSYSKFLVWTRRPYINWSGGQGDTSHYHSS